MSRGFISISTDDEWQFRNFLAEFNAFHPDYAQRSRTAEMMGVSLFHQWQRLSPRSRRLPVTVGAVTEYNSRLYVQINNIRNAAIAYIQRAYHVPADISNFDLMNMYHNLLELSSDIERVGLDPSVEFQH